MTGVNKQIQISVRQLAAIAAAFAILLAASNVEAMYRAGDHIFVWISKVSPYEHHQLSEGSFDYYSLIFCPAHGIRAHKFAGIHEGFLGPVVDSQIYIQFMRNVEGATICVTKLDNAKILQLKHLIDNQYFFQLEIGDQKIQAFVGAKAGGKYFIWAHMNFTIQLDYNSKVVAVKLLQENLIPLGTLLKRTYSVTFHQV